MKTHIHSKPIPERRIREEVGVGKIAIKAGRKCTVPKVSPVFDARRLTTKKKKKKTLLLALDDRDEIRTPQMQYNARRKCPVYATQIRLPRVVVYRKDTTRPKKP